MKATVKERLKGLTAGVLVGATLVGGIVYAEKTTKTIDATYDDIKIVLDGEVLELRDANGAEVEPFIYNGTTYLPVRAVSEACQKRVGWNGEEQTVTLNTMAWFEQCGAYDYSGVAEYRAKNKTNQYFTMSGGDYTDGFVFKASDYEPTSMVNFYPDGKFNSFRFSVGHLDDAKEYGALLNIYLDGTLSFTKELKPNEDVKRLEVPLNGAKEMKIELIENSEETKTMTRYGIAEGEWR